MLCTLGGTTSLERRSSGWRLAHSLLGARSASGTCYTQTETRSKRYAPTERSGVIPGPRPARVALISRAKAMSGLPSCRASRWLETLLSPLTCDTSSFSYLTNVFLTRTDRYMYTTQSIPPIAFATLSLRTWVFKVVE